MKIDLTPLMEMLRSHPDHMFVTDEVIAVLLPDDRVMLIGGDFKGITAEEANLRLQEELRKIQ